MLFGRRQTGQIQNRPIVQTPLPQRLEGLDTNPYIQPIPYALGNYQTFWRGNQLPGLFIHTAPHPYYVRMQSQDFAMPQLKGGNFGTVLGQQSSASLIARMHTAWSLAKARY